MPRQPRLDTPGALHHAMGQGIAGLKIFGDRKDCEDFLRRLKDLCESEALNIYAWALMDNHFHLHQNMRCSVAASIGLASD